eukprot:NODE_554_length_6758_cov_0.359964.p4 type:complete len:159 gc:universal NODE_554_length_6758_cov_0.359964:2807-3283(+)
MFCLFLILFNAEVLDWDVNYTKTIPSALKSSWCARQVTNCKVVCYTTDQPEPVQNTCDSDTLNYKCVCGDSVEPKLDMFSDTIPYFECTEVLSRCQQNCGGKTNEQTCKSNCMNIYQCATTAPNSADRVPLSGKKSVQLDGAVVNNLDLKLLYLLVLH